MSSVMVLIRLLVFLPILFVVGCASVFDAPYVELRAEVPKSSLIQSTLVQIEIDDLRVPAGRPKRKEYIDLWSRIRQGFDVADFDSDPSVKRTARRLANDRFFERAAQRATTHLYYVVEEVESRRLPMELVLVPFVESGYFLQARSPAEAHGAWQFIEDTAKTYALGIDRFRDDRLSLVTSTRAALDYLSVLHGMFTSWPLAMAAYNCGEKRIQAEIDRAKARGIKAPGFNDIAPRLPQETRDYVPRIFALKMLIENPAMYKAKLPHIINEPLHTVVEIQRDMDIHLVTRLAGMSPGEFQALNPSFRSPIIMRGDRTQLLLPHSAALRLSENMQTHTGPWISWRMVRVTRPTTAGELARRNNLSVRSVTKANPLTEGGYYAVGSIVLLPIAVVENSERVLAQTVSRVN